MPLIIEWFLPVTWLEGRWLWWFRGHQTPSNSGWFTNDFKHEKQDNKMRNKRRIAMTGIINWVETKQPRLKGRLVHLQPRPGWRYITVQFFFSPKKEKVGKGMKCGFWNYFQSLNNRLYVENMAGREGTPRNWQYSESLASPIAAIFSGFLFCSTTSSLIHPTFKLYFLLPVSYPIPNLVPFYSFFRIIKLM